MAPTQTTNGATAECPVCEEFEDKPESVEAHISGSSDDLHQGEVGRQYRSDLETSVSVGEIEGGTDVDASAAGVETVVSVEDSESDTDVDASAAGVETSASVEDMEGDTDGDSSVATGALLLGGGSLLAGETASEGGLGVSSRTMLLGGAVLLAVVVGWMLWTGDDAGSGVEEQPGEQSDEVVDTEAGTGGVMT